MHQQTPYFPFQLEVLFRKVDFTQNYFTSGGITIATTNTWEIRELRMSCNLL